MSEQDRPFYQWFAENKPPDAWPDEALAWFIDNVPQSEWPPALVEFVGCVPERFRSLDIPTKQVVAAAKGRPMVIRLPRTKGQVTRSRANARRLVQDEDFRAERLRLVALRNETGEQLLFIPGYEIETVLDVAAMRVMSEARTFSRSTPFEGIEPDDVAVVLWRAAMADTEDPGRIEEFVRGTQPVLLVNPSRRPAVHVMPPESMALEIQTSGMEDLAAARKVLADTADRLGKIRPGPGRTGTHDSIYEFAESQYRQTTGMTLQRLWTEVIEPISADVRPKTFEAFKRGRHTWKARQRKSGAEFDPTP